MGAARRGASRPRAGSVSPEKERRILLQEISPPSASVWTMYFHFERQRIKIDWFHHFFKTRVFSAGFTQRVCQHWHCWSDAGRVLHLMLDLTPYLMQAGL